MTPLLRSRRRTFSATVEALEPRVVMSQIQAISAAVAPLTDFNFLIAQRNVYAYLRLHPFSAALSTASSPRHDGQVTSPHIDVVGQSFPNSWVLLGVSGVGPIQLKRADALGRFDFALNVRPGDTTIIVQELRAYRSPLSAVVKVHLPAPANPDLTPPVIDVAAGIPEAPRNQNPTISGRVTDVGTGVQSLTYQIDSGSFAPLAFDASGNFRFTTSLPLDHSADGLHNVRLRAVDRAGNVTTTGNVAFTLDTTPPAVPAFSLDPASDTAPLGDNATTNATVTLDGTGEPGSTITLQGTSISSGIDASGKFQLVGVPLTLGANALVVVATDGAGNSSQANGTITRLAAGTALANFQIDTTRVLVGSTNQFLFTAGVTSPLASTKVELFTSNAAGVLGTELAPMLDNGDPVNGDAIASDGTYSNTFSLQTPTAGDSYFAAMIVGSAAPPLLVHVTAIAAPSAARLQSLSDQSQTLSGQLTTALTGGQPAAAALDAIKQALLAQPDLTDPSSIEVTANGIAWNSTEGIPSALLLDDLGFDTTRGSSSSSSRSTSILVAPPPDASPAAATIHADAVAPPPQTLCGKAKVIAPYFWQFSVTGGDESAAIATALTTAGATVSSVANKVQGDQTVALDDFKDFSQYTTVVITTHGNRFVHDGVVLNTGVVKGPLTSLTHLGDLIAGRLVLGASAYLISPKWISQYAGKMNKTVVYVGACHSADGASMANAFTGKGAAAYFGYTLSVGSAFANARGVALYTHLIAGGTVGAAPGLGTSDPGAPHAVYTLTAPDNTVKLPNPCGVADLFVSYRWPNSQKDLDTSTVLFGSGVGYACNNNSPYLVWSGDDTSAGGTETVIVHLKASHDAKKWTDTVTVALNAGWYIPAHGTGPALLSVALIDPTTGKHTNVIQRTINPGAQSTCASTPVGTVTITATGDPGKETETFTLT